jgi:class 3 adenylate cyclase/tetratricopeptide (TPR) repeat protein
MALHHLIQNANQLLEKGDYFAVYDCVQKPLEDGEFNADLVYLGLLALARSGATRQALQLYETFHERLPDESRFLSLLARLYKDLCINSKDERSQAQLGLRGRELYMEAYNKNPAYYPLINAATLSLLVGDEASSRQQAEAVLDLCSKENDSTGIDGFYLKATQAEACLLLGQVELAKDRLAEAREFCPWDLGNLSTTYQQLKRICKKREIPLDSLEAIRPPTVITYTGQMVHGIGKSPGIDPADEEAIRIHITALLDQHQVRVAYGSLACGADIMVAEAVLETQGELNIILPFGREEFKKISVAPGGESWERRYEAILSRASSVTQIVDEAITGHELLFEACSRQGMGLAHLRSQTLGSRAYQIAVWNQLNVDNPAGTSGAMRRWNDLGMENLIVPVPPPRNEGVTPTINIAPAPPGLQRQMKAMIFADVKGFSAMNEREVAVFMTRWLNALNSIKTKHDDHIQYINTWGDAAYLVIDEVPTAATLALELAGIFNDWDFSDLNLPSNIGLRVAAHVGPIFQTDNPVLGKPDFFGKHVNQTARLEPCTPPGSVYVTEPFASLISLEGNNDYRCEYVGNHPLPKGFGRIRMYHLKEL